MGLVSWVQRLPTGRYRVRLTIPARLRSLFNDKTILTQSLNTADPAAARRRAVPVVAELQRQLAEAEAALTNPSVAAYRAVQEVQASDLDDDAAEALDAHLTMKLEEDDLGERRLEPSERAAFLAILNRDHGASSPPLSVLFARWEKETRCTPKTAWEWSKIREKFTTLALGGADAPVGLIQRHHVLAYKDALLVLDRSPATISKAIAALKSVFAFGVNNGLLVANPATGVRVSRRSHGERTRLPYTVEDARALLLDASRHQDGTNRWLPWLAAYTGCRLAELAGLRSDDVRQVDGVWCLVIEDSAVRRIKTKSSRRTVPLSPVLIEAGFLAHVESTRASGRVFPNVAVDALGTCGAAWSKWYARWARRIVPDRRKVFHSWRHLVEDRLRDAAVPEDQRDALLGHSSSRQGRRYGAGYSVAVLLEAVKRIRY
jgi:integrase